MKFLFLFTFQSVNAYRKFANSTSKVMILRHDRISRLQENILFRSKVRYVTRKQWNQVFVWKWKLLAYHLEDLHVPLVVHIPQVGTAPDLDGGGPGAQTWWKAPYADKKSLGRGDRW